MALRQVSKQQIVKHLGGATYIFWVFQLLWMCTLYIQTIFQSPIGKLVKPDAVIIEVPEQTQAVTSSGFSLPEPLILLIALVGGAALIAAAIYAIFRSYIPEVQRAARTSIQKVAEVGAEQVVRHHIAPKKKRPILTVRLLFWIKLFLSLLPVPIVYGLQNSTMYMPRELAEIATVLLAFAATILVLLQHFFMERWRIYRETE